MKLVSAAVAAVIGIAPSRSTSTGTNPINMKVLSMIAMSTLLFDGKHVRFPLPLSFPRDLLSPDLTSLTTQQLFLIFSQAAAQPPAWEVKADIFPNDDPDFTPVLSPDRGFGWSIDVSGDTLIAGSRSFDYGYDESVQNWVPIEPHPGSARIFVRVTAGSNVDWEQQGDPLIVNDGEGGAYYGYRVAIDGDTALIAATQYAIDEYRQRVFVFQRSGGVWVQEMMLHVDKTYHDNVLRVAIEGDTGK